MPNTLFLPNIVTARFIFRIADVANFKLWVGFGDDIDADRLGDNSLLVEYDSASSSTFTFVSKSGGVAVTDSGTTEPTNGTWYCVDFVRTDANIMQFYVNEELEGEITGLASAAVGRMVSGMTLSASARSYDIDLARFEIVSDERF